MKVKRGRMPWELVLPLLLALAVIAFTVPYYQGPYICYRGGGLEACMPPPSNPNPPRP